MTPPHRQNVSERIFSKYLIFMVVVSVFAALFIRAAGLALQRSKIAQAKAETRFFEQTVLNYHTVYKRLPATTGANGSGNSDFTYGTVGLSSSPLMSVNALGSGYHANNSEPFTILLAKHDPFLNPQHLYNPKKIVFLRPTFAKVPGGPGLDPRDGVYRDPWRMPYIISFDLNDDGWVQDAFYSTTTFSQAPAGQTNGLKGLRSISGMATNDFGFRGRVMIWSFGPDGKADPNLRADEGVNADNILSWR